ncbi:MAG: hypothetical protein R2880_10420 [Deinococcales bacterium]
MGRIYLFFAKFQPKLSCRYRLYQECLYDIAVTHSPRYLIDMELAKGRSIFDKIGLTYDVLRASENPIKPFINYYRSIAKRGEEPWWMEGVEPSKVTVSLWSHLSLKEQRELRCQAMARFPEIFGRSSQKYQRLATWLVARHGIVDASLRDRFSAGGQVNISLKGKLYQKIPKIFEYLFKDYENVLKVIHDLSLEDAEHYWKLLHTISTDEKSKLWADQVMHYVKDHSVATQALVRQLLE